MNIDQIKMLIGDLVLQNAVLSQEIAELKAKLGMTPMMHATSGDQNPNADRWNGGQQPNVS